MVKEVFEKLCAEKGVSPSYVCRKIGISVAAYSQWTSNTIPRNTTLKNMANYFNVSIDYLKTGIEDVLKKSGAFPITDIATVPIYGKVAAGAGMFADDEIIGMQPIFNNMVKNVQDCFCLKVEGDSMLPRIQDGDIILVRKQTSVDSGSYAVVLIDDENGVVKKVVYDKDSVTLISINPNYPPRTFSGADLLRLQVLGEVIQIISTLK